MATQAIGLYVHIPFCQTKCTYCDFNTYARLEHLIPTYTTALQNEIECWGSVLDHPRLDTLFFGGGTPSWLPVEVLPALIQTIRNSFTVPDGIEITAEANPGDTSRSKMDAWKMCGINRVSMGIQSFDDTMLNLMTRRHSAAEAISSFRQVRSLGFESVSFDLIYGLPTQTLHDWEETLNKAIELYPPHISLYALTVEEATPWWIEISKGSLPQPDPDLAGEMYECSEKLLGEAGYGHYEISNWALDGHESRHNLANWRNKPFLGVGPGAHSYLDQTRFWNLKSPQEYIRRLTGTKPPSSSPVIDDRFAVNAAHELSETLILNLRLGEGINLTSMQGRYDPEAISNHRKTLEEHAKLGLVVIENDVFKLTARGRLLSNELFVHLLPN